MRSMLRVVTPGIVAVVSVARLCAQLGDPLIGTWELNLAKSTYGSGPSPTKQTRTYEVVGQGGVKGTTKGVDADGKPTLSQYTANYDGKDYRLTGVQAADMISLKRVDQFTSEYILKVAGKVVSTSRRAISKDGKTMTITTTDAGTKTRNVLVFDKR